MQTRYRTFFIVSHTEWHNPKIVEYKTRFIRECACVITSRSLIIHLIKCKEDIQDDDYDECGDTDPDSATPVLPCLFGLLFRRGSISGRDGRAALDWLQDCKDSDNPTTTQGRENVQTEIILRWIIQLLRRDVDYVLRLLLVYDDRLLMLLLLLLWVFIPETNPHLAGVWHQWFLLQWELLAFLGRVFWK